MSSTAAARHRDGRTARGERTRAAIVDAHIGLLTDGVLQPTGEQITTRAGVSARSLWVHFTDLEALFTATAAETLARQEARFVPIDAGLPLPGRVAGFCRQRAQVLERLAPMARASVLREPFSPALRDYHRRHLVLVRAEVEVLFAAELADRTPDDQTRLVDAVVVSSTWGAWSTLRDRLGLDVDGATAVMESTLAALVRASP
jgi:TetR/AcrR family transcriptional regulator of autoinduction and epiphytic fitness